MAGALNVRSGFRTQSCTSVSGCGSRVGLSTSVLKTLYRVVVAPMPTERVSTATSVNPGDLRRERNA
jgi:hypothetical protein